MGIFLFPQIKKYVTINYAKEYAYILTREWTSMIKKNASFLFIILIAAAMLTYILIKPSPNTIAFSNIPGLLIIILASTYHIFRNSRENEIE